MTTAERADSRVHWRSPVAEGYRARGFSAVVRLPLQEETNPKKTTLAADIFTFDGSTSILGHRLLDSAEGTVRIESCKLSIAAAAAADCGVTALAAAEGEGPDAPLHLFAGLTNGQIWHLEAQQHQKHGEQNEQELPFSLAAVSKNLLYCRMAEPVDVACCFICCEEQGGEEAALRKSCNSWNLMVIVLYGDGTATALWPSEGRTEDLPAVEGGRRLCISPLGSFVAISTSNRRLTVLKRSGRSFSVSKDFYPLRLLGAGGPVAQPAWVGEDKLLVPGASQLRCICNSSAWKEAEEPPFLPGNDVPRELLLLQYLSSAAEEQSERKSDAIICGVATDGTVGIWAAHQAKPLMLIECGREGQIRTICCYSPARAVCTLILLHTDGSLGFLSLPPEVREASGTGLEAAGASCEDGLPQKKRLQATKPTDQFGDEGKEKKDDTGSDVSPGSVEAFLSREAAEASSEGSNDDLAADILFDDAESVGSFSPKKKDYKHRKNRGAGGTVANEGNVKDLPDDNVAEMEEDEEVRFPAAVEPLASRVAALQSQLQGAQAMLNILLKRQREVRQPLIHPGGGPQPSDAGKPWCLFWTHLGHITKTVTAENSVLDVFNFFPGAAADGTAHRKLADLQNCSTACLCRAGVAMAAEGSSHGILEFRSFLDAGSWVKYFPEGEKVLAVAAGDSFVASVTDARTLRIFTLAGTVLYTADVVGRPVSLCASQQLLVVLTQTGNGEGAVQLHCSVMHVHPNPAAPTATFRLPISCLKRRLVAPPAAASCAPDIDIIHEGFFDVDSPLDWIGISPGGMPAVKDTSGVVRGLLPVAGRRGGVSGYAFKWVKICSLAEASANSLLFPIVIDEAKGELGVVRLKSGDGGAVFPDCSVSEAFFGYAMEQIPLRIPSPDLWSFSRWQRLWRQDKQLKGVGDGGGDAALVPWPQYDELRLQQELAIRQLNHYVNTCGGSSVGDAECENEAREAQRKLQILTKRHDKFCLRGFAKCTDDKRLHGVAKEMALRLKTDNAPQHARTLLDSDTRLQAEKLREVLLWQEQQRVHFGEAAAAAVAVSVDARASQNDNWSQLHCTQKTEEELSSAQVLTASVAEKKSSIQKLLQWQQQQQQRKSSDGGLVALFDGQKRRASETGSFRPLKKSFFHNAD